MKEGVETIRVRVMVAGLTAAKKVWNKGDELDVPIDHPLATMALGKRRAGPCNSIAVQQLTARNQPKLERIGPKDHDHTHSVLVIRSRGGLGDLLMTSVAVRAYRREYPATHITYAVPKQIGCVQSNNPDADEVVQWNGEVRDRDRLAQFDKVFDLTSLDSAYESKTYPAVDKSRMELYCEEMGVRPSDWTPFYRVTEDEARDARNLVGRSGKLKIGLGLRSASSMRNLEPSIWMELAALLINRLGCEIFLFDRSDSVGWSGPGITRICGFPIREMAAVLAEMDCAVVLDSGLLHLAGALGIPGVALFGSTDPRYRADRYSNIVVRYGVHRCRHAPCWYGPKSGGCDMSCMKFDPLELFWSVLYALGPRVHQMPKVNEPAIEAVRGMAGCTAAKADSPVAVRRWSVRKERVTAPSDGTSRVEATVAEGT